MRIYAFYAITEETMSACSISRLNREAGKPSIVVLRRRRRAGFGLAGTERAGAESVTLALPLPPWANTLLTNSAEGRRHKSETYAGWLSEARWRLHAQRPGRVIGTYRMLVEVARRKDRCRVDIGHYEKALSDLLVAHHIVQDDSLAQEITLRWADVEGVRVTVSRWPALSQ
jgi:Holliday junction resolvase RusA-like endonuclease